MIASERQKWDELLKKILSLPKVQEDLEELRKDEEWNKEHEWSKFEIAENALENFMKGDDKDILAVPEIWQAVQEEIRKTADWITYTAKTFIAEMSSLNAEDIYHKKLEEIHDALYDALKRKHGKT